MKKLANKTAIITGAASGMGAQHGIRFIKEGAKVVFTDTNKEKGEQVVKNLGKNALFIPHDVSNPKDWKKVVDMTEEKFGPVSILINNAGVAIPNGGTLTLENTEFEGYKKIIEINQFGTLFGMQAVLPSLRKAGGGSIINVSSVGGLLGMFGHYAYNASKFAIRGMTKTAAIELGEENIRVNSVHPGMIETSMIKASIEKNPEIWKDQLKGIPLHRMGKPEEVSSLMVFLASDESSYCTGAEFIIDGGKTCEDK